MKKVLLVLLSLLVSSYAFAESPQLQYIKGMYEESVLLENSDPNSYNLNYFLKYFDNNIYKIYVRDDKYTDLRNATTGCINRSVLWQGQEWDSKAKLTFTEPQKDIVKVTIGTTKGFKERSVLYQVKCNQSNSCKITEIFEEGKPFTKEVTKCLDKIYRISIKKN